MPDAQSCLGIAAPPPGTPGNLGTPADLEAARQRARILAEILGQGPSIQDAPVDQAGTTGTIFDRVPSRAQARVRVRRVFPGNASSRHEGVAREISAAVERSLSCPSTPRRHHHHHHLEHHHHGPHHCRCGHEPCG